MNEHENKELSGQIKTQVEGIAKRVSKEVLGQAVLDLLILLDRVRDKRKPEAQMRTGKLTPRSNNCVDAMRFSGGFDQPDGFASVLDVKINEGGEACLTLTHRENGNESTWSVMLTDSQRNALAAMLGEYKPRTFERYDPRSTCN